MRLVLGAAQAQLEVGVGVPQLAQRDQKAGEMCPAWVSLDLPQFRSL